MSGTKTEIKFPCKWTYTLIGLQDKKIEEAVNQVFANRQFSVSFSKKSCTGKYISMYVSTNVRCREERDDFFEKLKNHEAIQIVL